MIDRWEICAPNLAEVFSYYCRRHFGASPFSTGVIRTAEEKAGFQANELDFLRDKAASFTLCGFACTTPSYIGCIAYRILNSRLGHPADMRPHHSSQGVAESVEGPT